MTTFAPDVDPDHMLHMCHVLLNAGNSSICVYYGSTQHTLGNYTNQPNDNREEPRSTSKDLCSQGPNYGANPENLGIP